MSKELLTQLLAQVKVITGQSTRDDEGLEAIEAALQAAIAQPEPHPPHRQCECRECKVYFAPEPVAYWIPKAEQFCLPPKDGTRPFAKAWEPLYTHPPAVREPLTREQALAIVDGAGYSDTKQRADFLNGLRHGELAHGITAPPIQARHLPADDTEGGAA